MDIKLINFVLTDPLFYLALWSLLLTSVVFNYSIFLCTSMNSALTTSLVGVAKSTIQTLIGFFTFGGIEYDIWTMTGKKSL